MTRRKSEATPRLGMTDRPLNPSRRERRTRGRRGRLRVWFAGMVLGDPLAVRDWEETAPPGDPGVLAHLRNRPRLP